MNGVKHKILIDFDDITKIIRKELLEVYKDFLKTHKAIKNGEDYLPVFDTDPEEDKKKVKEMIKALKMVINYHSKPDQKIK